MPWRSDLWGYRIPVVLPRVSTLAIRVAGGAAWLWKSLWNCWQAENDFRGKDLSATSPRAGFPASKALNSNQLGNSFDINMGRGGGKAEHIPTLGICTFSGSDPSVSRALPRESRAERALRQAGPRLKAVFADLQNGQESLLGDIDAADALHAFFAFFLFFQELAFARNVAAVAFGDHVLADGGDGFAGDNFRADRSLDRDFEHLPGNELPAFSRPAALPRS